MSVSIITFANLGKKQNLPTIDILPVIDSFAKRGALGQIICQIQKDFYFKHTQEALPGFVRHGLRAFEMLFRIPITRRTTERLFDYFASKKAEAHTVTLFHGGFFLSRTFWKLKNNNVITVEITRNAHIGLNADIEQEEINLLGIPDTKGAYTKLLGAISHLTSFDYVIAISDFVKRSYVEAGFSPEKVFVAHPDIRLERFSPKEKIDTKFRVVYAAYTTPLKGLGYLLDAWETLSLTDAELVLVGGYGELPKELKEKYSKRIKNNDSVSWVGHTPAPETYYADASVFVFPSLTEGFGRVTLEAMACGIPVITTENAKGIVEDGKTGFVVPIRDAKAIAEKIQYLYDHQDMAQEMGKEARRAVENKKPFGEAVYEIYEEIMRREGKAIH